jgi:hypothetical protein
LVALDFPFSPWVFPLSNSWLRAFLYSRTARKNQVVKIS